MPPAATVTCPNCGAKNRIRAQPEGVPRCGKCHNALPWVVDADAATFDAEITSTLPVLIDFWAPWCGPCRMVSPVIDEYAREHAGEIKVVKLNVDEAAAIGARYGVQGIPLLVLVQGGQERDRLVGAPPPAALREWISERLATAPAGQPGAR